MDGRNRGGATRVIGCCPTRRFVCFGLYKKRAREPSSGIYCICLSCCIIVVGLKWIKNDYNEFKIKFKKE